MNHLVVGAMLALSGCVQAEARLVQSTGEARITRVRRTDRGFPTDYSADMARSVRAVPGQPDSEFLEVVDVSVDEYDKRAGADDLLPMAVAYISFGVAFVIMVGIQENSVGIK